MTILYFRIVWKRRSWTKRISEKTPLQFNYWKGNHFINQTSWKSSKWKKIYNWLLNDWLISFSRSYTCEHTSQFNHVKSGSWKSTDQPMNDSWQISIVDTHRLIFVQVRTEFLSVSSPMMKITIEQDVSTRYCTFWLFFMSNLCHSIERRMQQMNFDTEFMNNQWTVQISFSLFKRHDTITETMKTSKSFTRFFFNDLGFWQKLRINVDSLMNIRDVDNRLVNGSMMENLIKFNLFYIDKFQIYSFQ